MERFLMMSAPAETAGRAKRNNGRVPDSSRPRIGFGRLTAVAFLGLIWALGGAGCGGQSQRAADSGGPARSADSLALAVANSSQGPISIANSPYGRGWATVGQAYLSALGLPCRPVIFLSENQDRYDLAVCAEKNGVWSTAPNIFAASKYEAP